MARKGNKLSSVTGSLVKSGTGISNVRGRCTARAKSKIKRMIVEKLKNKGVVIPDIFRLRSSEAYKLAYDNGIDPKDPDEFPYAATRCSYEPLPGANVCRHHGGLVPVVAQRAQKRLLMEAPFALSAIHSVLTSGQMTGPVISAAKLVMDSVQKYNDKREQEENAGMGVGLGDMSRLSDDEVQELQRLLKKMRETSDTVPNDMRIVGPNS